MRKIKFLHCADLHMDMPFTSLSGDGDKAMIRRNDQKEVLKQIINLSKAEKVDLILISGDLFEHEYIKRATLYYINNLFASIPEIHIVISPGNHDPYIINSVYATYPWNKNVSIFGAEKKVFAFDTLCTRVYGAAFQNFHEGQTLLYGIGPVDKAFINIFCVHGTLDMNFSKKVQNPMQSEHLDALKMDYVAMGHFHTHFEGLGENKNIYNPGSPEALGFDEEGEHGVFIGEISLDDDSERDLDVRYIKMGIRRYRSIEILLEGTKSEDWFRETLYNSVRSEERANTLLQVILKGTFETENGINIQKIIASLSGEFFFLKVKDETSLGLDIEGLIQENSIRGLFTRSMLEKIDSTLDSHQKKILKNALHYGLSALENGRVEI